MYRQYENPYTLEDQLEEMKRKYVEAVETSDDEYYIEYLAEAITELKDRINFAWQDDAEDDY